MLTFEINDLKRSLNFLHLVELKDICGKLKLSEKGKKGELISRIIKFIETGEKLVNLLFPKMSCAKPGELYELTEDAFNKIMGIHLLILKDSIIS